MDFPNDIQNIAEKVDFFAVDVSVKMIHVTGLSVNIKDAILVRYGETPFCRSFRQDPLEWRGEHNFPFLISILLEKESFGSSPVWIAQALLWASCIQ